MASAAALTLGRYTIPVYEIYKVGEAPRWLPGLDLLRRRSACRSRSCPTTTTPRAATTTPASATWASAGCGSWRRSCPDTFVLGVDGHTALVLDLDAERLGLGPGRRHGPQGRPVHGLPGGSEMRDRCPGRGGRRAGVREGTADRAGSRRVRGRARRWVRSPASAPRRQPLRSEAANLEGSFFAALAGGDARTAVAALLDLDEVIEGRIRGGEDSPDLDNARSTFRSLLVRLGEAAAGGEGRTRGPPSNRSWRHSWSCVPAPARPVTGRPPTWSGTASRRPGSRSATRRPARPGAWTVPQPVPGRLRPVLSPAEAGPDAGESEISPPSACRQRASADPRTAPRRTSTAAARASSIPAAKIGHGYGPGRPPPTSRPASIVQDRTTSTPPTSPAAQCRRVRTRGRPERSVHARGKTRPRPVSR